MALGPEDGPPGFYWALAHIPKAFEYPSHHLQHNSPLVLQDLDG